MKKDLVSTMFKQTLNYKNDDCRFSTNEIAFRIFNVSSKGNIKLLRSDSGNNIIIDANRIVECDYKTQYKVGGSGSELFYICDMKDKFRTKIIVGEGVILIKDINSSMYSLFMCLCDDNGRTCILANMYHMSKMNSTRLKIFKSALSVNIPIDISDKNEGMLRNAKIIKDINTGYVVNNIFKSMPLQFRKDFINRFIYESEFLFKDIFISSYRNSNANYLESLLNRTMYVFNKD